jgi:hypothetical protein
MTMISFAPTSRPAILPSGDTFDLVSPGMSRVVARTLEGVRLPLRTVCCVRGWLGKVSLYYGLPSNYNRNIEYCAAGKDNVCDAYICGLPGALDAGVIAGVSVNAAPSAALMECCTGICLVVALPFEAAIRPKAVFGGGMRPAPG